MSERPPHAERLRRLRQELGRQEVEGFVLPRTDAHGSEYLPACEERLAWLTGFTGSAGWAVVLSGRAAVFVDGRYTVQVRAEVDQGLFEVVHLIERPPSKWLEAELPEGAAIGYDPRLHTRAGLDRLAKAVAKRGGRLSPLAANPVDRVWEDRPPPPVAPVEVLDPRFAGKSSADKRLEIAAKVKEAGADWLFVSAADNIAWLLNVRGCDVPFNPLALSYLLLADDGRCRWLVDPAKLPAGLGLDNAVEVVPVDRLEAVLDGLGGDGSRVMVDPALVHAAFLDRLEGAGARLVEQADPLVLAKAVKNAVEIEGATNAQRRDGAAVARFLTWLDAQPLDGSLGEAAAAARLGAERARDPLYRGPSFPTIAGHGPNAALPHYRTPETGGRPLTPGVFLVDSGGQYLDGTTDITRTVALGEVDPAVRRPFTLVLKGHIALARQAFPKGTTGAQLDALARLPLWSAGLDFDHGTGHGIGSYLCVHEGPQRFAKTGHAVLEPGMILSNEPGYYREGAFGIRIENLVLVAEAAIDGAERPMLALKTLTLAPIDRRLIDLDCLAPDERAWLDAYHARVLEEVGPLVDGATRRWLDAACAPL